MLSLFNDCPFLPFPCRRFLRDVKILVLGSGVRARLSSLTLGLSGSDSADSDENSARHFPVCFTFSKWEDVKAELQATLNFNGALEHNAYRRLPWNATAVNVSSPNAAEEIKCLNCILPFNVVSEKYLRCSSCPDTPEDFQSPANFSSEEVTLSHRILKNSFCRISETFWFMKVRPAVKWTLASYSNCKMIVEIFWKAGRQRGRPIDHGRPAKSLKTENRVVSIERRFSTKILSGLPVSVPFYTGGLWVICFSLLYCTAMWTVDAAEETAAHQSKVKS